VAGRDLAAIEARLVEALAGANLCLDHEPALAWSVGIVPFEAGSLRALDALVLDADRRMYLAKRVGAHRISFPVAGR
jgi:GGDEF domain-containing protein